MKVSMVLSLLTLTDPPKLKTLFFSLEGKRSLVLYKSQTDGGIGVLEVITITLFS